MEASEKIKVLAEKLKAANPLFSGNIHFPDGFVDFRGLVFPCEFHAGPFFRTDGSEGRLLVGCEEMLRSASDTLINQGYQPKVCVPDEPEETTPCWSNFVALSWKIPC